MAPPSPTGLYQRIQTVLLIALVLLSCLRPHQESSSSNPNQLVLSAADDLEAANPSNLPESSGGITSQTQLRQSLGIQSPTGSPPADHSVTEREGHVSQSPVALIRGLWYRSESTSPGLPVTQHMQRQPQNPQSPLGFDNTVTGLTFQAVVGLGLVGKPLDQSDGMHHLHIFGMIMLLAFACSFSGTVLSRAYPRLRAGRFLEQMGVLSTAVGFYLLASIFLPNNLTWICWVAAAYSFIVFILVLITGEQGGEV